MDPHVLGLLEAADDATHCEHPEGFEWGREMAAVKELIQSLEAMTGRRWSVDENVQDASFLTDLSALDEQALPDGGVLSNTILGVRFSAFG